MTRYFRDVEHEAKSLQYSLKKVNGEKGEQDFENIHRPRLESFALRAACRLMRFYAKSHEKMAKAASEAGRVKFSVMVIPSGTPGMVYAFPNIPRGKVPVDAFHDVTPLRNFEAVQPFWDKLQADLEDPKKAKGWETCARSWKRIRKTEELTVQKALIKYGSSSGKPCSDIPDHVVRDIGQHITEAFQPPEVHWTQTPEDYVTMYFAGGPESCMSIGRGLHDQFEFLYKEHGICPASFYYYHPYSQGVYLKEKGKVAARAIVYHHPGKKGHESKEIKWYARIYSSNDRARQKLQEELNEHGYVFFEYVDSKIAPAGVRDGDLQLNVQFDIPVWHSKSAGGVIPLPHLDNMTGPVHGKYNKDSDTVTITMECRREDTNIQSGTQGYHPIALLMDARCKTCNHQIRNGRHAIIPSDSHDVFCSPEHAERKNYVMAEQNDGTRVWISKSNTIEDAIMSGRYYTNEAAALALGARPAVKSLTEPDEEAGLSLEGILVGIEDSKIEFRVHPYTLDQFKAVYGEGKDILYRNRDKKAPKEPDFILKPQVFGKITAERIQKVRTVQYDSEDTFAKINGSLDFLPADWEENMPKGPSDPSMLQFDAGICKINMVSSREEAQRHAFQFAA